MAKFNWEKHKRDNRYRPSRWAEPATQRQIDYILGLAEQKGQPRPPLPKTKRGAHNAIERLLALPDVHERVEAAPVERQLSPRDELVIELRERFPQLTPMTCNSLIQLFEQVDAFGLPFALGTLSDDLPTETDALIIALTRALLDAIDPVTDDAEALVG